MLISIIIPSFNQGNYIEQAIVSILDQDFKAIEILVIDNKSTDNTKIILKKYENKIRVISEKDFGQSDALNKGLKLASGEIIGWINADDYYEKRIFKIIAEHFEDVNINWLVGNSYYLFEDLNLVSERFTATIDYEKLLKDPDIVNQQAAFYRRSILKKVNGFNASLHMTMDFDLWIRLSKISKPIMVKNILAYYRIHKNQKSAGKFILLQSKEINAIMKLEKQSLFKRIKFLSKRYLLFFKFLIKTRILKVQFPNIPLRIIKDEKNKSIIS